MENLTPEQKALKVLSPFTYAAFELAQQNGEVAQVGNEMAAKMADADMSFMKDKAPILAEHIPQRQVDAEPYLQPLILTISDKSGKVSQLYFNRGETITLDLK